MHTQDHGDGIATRGKSVRPRTLVDRKRKRYDNVVDVVELLRNPTDQVPNVRHLRVHLDDVPRALDLAKCQGRVPSARWRGDDDDVLPMQGFA